MVLQIYSKAGCTYCEMAKEFLDERSMTYMETRLDPETDRDEIEMLKKRTGHKTFPFIFQDDDTQFIGGLRELMNLYDF